MVTASAPGRVNLIGEHTDYNDGFVLPVATRGRTTVRLTRRDDGLVRAASRELGGPFGYRVGEEERRGEWIDYVAGVTWALGLRDGFDLAIESDLPPGAGLGSSAALEIALGRGLRDLFGLMAGDEALVRIGRRAETGFVGAQTGVMDQIASSFGTPGQALLIDCRSEDHRLVPLPFDLVVLDSGVRHAHAEGGYNERRAECEEAARRLGVAALRDATGADGLPEPLRRRARHVIEENARVLAAVEALERADGAALGRLLDESHASQRDLFEVSVPEVDRLVELAREAGALGARLTGGGFGGAVVALAPSGAGPGLVARLEAAGASVLRPAGSSGG